MNKIDRNFFKLIESPGCKTLFSVIFPLAAALLSGMFVYDISDENGIVWIKFYQSWTFYGLLILIILIYIYNRALYRHNRDIMRFSDTTFCIAYMRSQLLPEAAERYKEMIRSGSGSEFAEITNQLKEILQ